MLSNLVSTVIKITEIYSVLGAFREKWGKMSIGTKLPSLVTLDLMWIIFFQINECTLFLFLIGHWHYEKCILLWKKRHSSRWVLIHSLRFPVRLVFPVRIIYFPDNEAVSTVRGSLMRRSAAHTPSSMMAPHTPPTPSVIGRSNIHLWQFIKELLNDPAYSGNVIVI